MRKGLDLSDAAELIEMLNDLARAHREERRNATAATFRFLAGWVGHRLRKDTYVEPNVEPTKDE